MARTIHQFEIDHVERVRQEFARETRTEVNIVQLTPGGLAYSGTWVHLPGIRLEWNCLDSRVRSKETQHEWGIIFCMSLPGSTAFSFRGLPVGDDIAFLSRKGEQMDYVTGPGTRTLIVCVHDHLMKSRKWQLREGAFRRSNGPALEKLTEHCRWITTTKDWDEQIENTALTTLLDLVETALHPWFESAPEPLPRKEGAFHFEVVEDVEKIWKKAGSGTPPAVPELSNQIGIPERTLFHAFKQAVGMGPIKYLQLLRLHLLRDRLLDADSDLKTVSEIAQGLGYDQMGRLAEYYKRHFLESPSQTLRRQVSDDQ